MATKRKKYVLTIQAKLEITEQFEKGAVRKQISLKNGIGKTTINDI